MSVRRGAGSGLARYVPAVGWLGGYQGSWLRGDLAAGLTTAAVVIPQAMAYATIAGLPVQVGLYVATVPMLVYALLGTSRPLSVSTTSTLAALTAAAVASAADGDPDRALVAASTLAALSGILLLTTGVLRLGFLADFISAPSSPGSGRHRAADRRRPARQDPRRPPGGRQLLRQGRLGPGPPG
jgi:MFS superfamily sulfate permease-like transporter